MYSSTVRQDASEIGIQTTFNANFPTEMNVRDVYFNSKYVKFIMGKMELLADLHCILTVFYKGEYFTISYNGSVPVTLNNVITVTPLEVEPCETDVEPIFYNYAKELQSNTTLQVTMLSNP